MPQELYMATPNVILHPTAPLAYNTIQHVIAKDYEWKMLEYILHNQASHLGSKSEDLQK